MAVVAVVGDGMAGAPGIASRVFSALSSGGINVVAIAQGSSERNISFAVTADQATEAARRVHSAFQLSKIGGGRAPAAPRTDVVLLGFGRVGRALADQIGAANGRGQVRVVGLLDRSGYIFDPRGISRRRLTELAREKDAGELLAALGGRPAQAAEALAVMAEPRRLAAGRRRRHERRDRRSAARRARQRLRRRPRQQEAARRIVGELRRPGVGAGHGSRQVKYEATVGAGLPIIDTYHKLVETGDRVLRMDGSRQRHADVCRLGRVGGRPFSQAVREAVDLGYAEPDPRDDFSGATPRARRSSSRG